MSSFTYAKICKPIQDTFVQSSAGYAHSSAPTSKTRTTMGVIGATDVTRLLLKALGNANARTHPGKPLTANTHLTIKSADVKAAADSLGRPNLVRDLRGGHKFTCEAAAAAEEKKKKKDGDDGDEEMKE